MTVATVETARDRLADGTLRVRDVPEGSGGIVWRKLPIPRLGSPNEGWVTPRVYLDPRDSIYHGEVIGHGRWRFHVRKDHRAERRRSWSVAVQVYASASSWAQWDGWVTVRGGVGWPWDNESLKQAKAVCDVRLLEGLSMRRAVDQLVDVARLCVDRAEMATKVDGIGGSLSWLAQAESEVQHANEVARLGGLGLWRLDVSLLEVVPMDGEA